MNILRLQARACATFLAVFAISANAATLGLSAPASVNQNDSFDVTIEGNFDDVNGLLAGGSLLGWEDAALDLNSVTLIGSADPALSCPPAVGSCILTADTVSVWTGSFGAVVGPGAGTVTLATLNFTAVGVGSGPGGSTDLTLANDPLAGGWFDLSFNDATPTFSGTLVTINAVPVPAAVWLFGSGVLGLVGVARRRKAA